MDGVSLKSKVLDVKMSTVAFYAALLAFKLLLDFSYVKIIFPQFQYMGFVLTADGMKVFSGFVLFFLMLLFIPRRMDKPSGILGLCLVVIIYLPTLTIFSYGDASYGFVFTNTAFWLIALSLIKFLPTIRLPRLKEKTAKIIFLSILLLICFYCCFFVIKTFGIHFNLNLLDVYGQREQYKAASIPLSSYLFTWSSNVILPLGFMYCFLHKRYLLSLLTLFSQLLLFSATGMKSMLFTIPLVILFAAFLKMKNVSLYLMLLLVSASLVCILFFFMFDQILPASLLLRRVFIVPARISQYYYEFFSETGQIRLAHSILSGLSGYRFEAEPAHFISRIFVGTTSNFNAGIVADGFANFGYIGVFCWSVITAFVFKLLDCVSNGKNKTLVVAGIIMFISSLSNSALVTNLGTHGIAISIFMLYLLPDGYAKEPVGVTVPQRKEHVQKHWRYSRKKVGEINETGSLHQS